MIGSEYRQAWAFLAAVPNPASDVRLLQASCALKLKEHHKALQILNEVKRNQMCKKVKVKALIMRSKVYRRMQLYEEALRDAMAA